MTVSVQLKLLRVGHCRHLACMAARGSRCRRVDFPALSVLIRHPHLGAMLYDTGYAEPFFAATQTLPEKAYRLSVPVTLPESEQLIRQLHHEDLSLADIRSVVISHYHGDHVAGLRNFSHAEFIALRADTEHILALRSKRFRATLGGYLPALLPEDFTRRVRDADSGSLCALPLWLRPFEYGFDLFGDGSLIGVPLPGHSRGQLGVLVPNTDSGRPAFLVADACWSLPALREGRPPARTALYLLTNPRRFMQTFHALHQLAQRETALALLPSHCSVAHEEWHHGQ